MLFTVLHSGLPHCPLKSWPGEHSRSCPQRPPPLGPSLAESGEAWAVPGTKVRPRGSPTELGAVCIYVSVRMYIGRAFLIPSLDRGLVSAPWSRLPWLGEPGAGRGAAAKLGAPQVQLRWAKAEPGLTPSPQHCAGHHRPPSETRAYPCWPGLRLPPSGTQHCPFSMLVTAGSGAPVVPFGLGQSVASDWVTGGPISPLPKLSHCRQSTTAFQLPGRCSVLQTPLAEAPRPRLQEEAGWPG